MHKRVNRCTRVQEHMVAYVHRSIHLHVYVSVRVYIHTTAEVDTSACTHISIFLLHTAHDHMCTDTQNSHACAQTYLHLELYMYACICGCLFLIGTANACIGLHVDCIGVLTETVFFFVNGEELQLWDCHSSTGLLCLTTSVHTHQYEVCFCDPLLFRQKNLHEVNSD